MLLSPATLKLATVSITFCRVLSSLSAAAFAWNVNNCKVLDADVSKCPRTDVSPINYITNGRTGYHTEEQKNYT